MNLPNKLTLGRMIATPLFMAAMLWQFPYHYTVALVLFVAASLTDMLDGKIARKYNLITDFGKFLDPLADKMLTTSAFIGFLAVFGGTTYAVQTAVVLFVVLFREFAVSSLRLVAVTAGGEVIAANYWGKAKTVCQMVGLVWALFCYVLTEDFGVTAIAAWGNISIIVLFWLSAALCVISGVIYLKGGWHYISAAK